LTRRWRRPTLKSEEPLVIVTLNESFSFKGLET